MEDVRTQNADGISPVELLRMAYTASIGKENYQVEFLESDDGVLVRVDERVYDMDALCLKPGLYSLLIAGYSYEVDIMEGTEEELIVVIRGQAYPVNIRDGRRRRSRGEGKSGDSGSMQRITAPMPGKVVRHLVQLGDTVNAGDRVIVLEAMKMENELKAPSAGIVKQFLAAEGAVVKGGDTLVTIE